MDPISTLLALCIMVFGIMTMVAGPAYATKAFKAVFAYLIGKPLKRLGKQIEKKIGQLLGWLVRTFVTRPLHWLWNHLIVGPTRSAGRAIWRTIRPPRIPPPP